MEISTVCFTLLFFLSKSVYFASMLVIAAFCDYVECCSFGGWVGVPCEGNLEFPIPNSINTGIVTETLEISLFSVLRC